VADLTVSSAVDTLMQASNQAGLRTAIGVVIGTDVQAYDADLAAIAGLTSAANKGIQFTGSGSAATYDLTAAGKALLDDADAEAQRTTLGLSNVDNTSDANKPISSATQTALDAKQPLDSDLTAIAALITTSFGRGLLTLASQTALVSFPTVTESTTARTLALTDAQKYIRTTNSSAVTVTVPPQVDVAWLADTEIILFVAGTGQVTIAAGSGVTINTPETLKSAKRYATMTLKRVASNTWDLSGNLEAA